MTGFDFTYCTRSRLEALKSPLLRRFGEKDGMRVLKRIDLTLTLPLNFVKLRLLRKSD